MGQRAAALVLLLLSALAFECASCAATQFGLTLDIYYHGGGGDDGEYEAVCNVTQEDAGLATWDCEFYLNVIQTLHGKLQANASAVSKGAKGMLYSFDLGRDDNNTPTVPWGAFLAKYQVLPEWVSQHKDLVYRISPSGAVSCPACDFYLYGEDLDMVEIVGEVSASRSA